MFQLLQWFHSQGIITEHIRIQQITQTSYGVLASQSIPPNQTIITIPLHLCIFSDDLLNNHYSRYKKYYPHIFNIQLNEDAEFNTLVLYILLQKDNQSSLHKPYFDYVKQPQNVLSWNQQQVDLILDLNLKKTIQKMRIGLELNFSRFVTFFKEQFKKELSYDLFLYAYQFVMTRCFGGDHHLQSSCLVPFGDMLNHHDKCQTKQKIIGTNLVFITTKPIKENEEIYNFFGEHGNSFLLCWYGFTYDDNIYDKIYLSYEDDQIKEVSCYEFTKSNFKLKYYKNCQLQQDLLNLNKQQCKFNLLPNSNQKISQIY
ncbi:unnamed protein product [Paramecium sonneborni]|uniref:SET domain-containing protein n=1 Tax=Paramecium sonneborni TaxID=65129 RepID=A0A8S1Q131_9CILI|nr:unnamed protein product [Paramecium sonneborni]